MSIEESGHLLRVGDHVKVGRFKPDDKTPHPHAYKTGRVTEIFRTYTQEEILRPHWSPKCMIRLDPHLLDGGHFIVVSISCMEIIP